MSLSQVCTSACCGTSCMFTIVVRRASFSSAGDCANVKTLVTRIVVPMRPKFITRTHVLFLWSSSETGMDSSTYLLSDWIASQDDCKHPVKSSCILPRRRRALVREYLTVKGAPKNPSICHYCRVQGGLIDRSYVLAFSNET